MSQYAAPPPLNYYQMHSGGDDRDSGLGKTIAWVVIIISVLALALANFREEHRVLTVAASDPPGVSIEVVGRYMIGTNALVAQQPNTIQIMVTEVNMGAKTAIDRLAAVTIIAELQGKQAALARLKELGSTLPPDLAPQVKALENLYNKGVAGLSSDDQSMIRDHLGWCGKLALTFELPASDPRRVAVLADGKKTLGVALGGLGMLGISMIAGIILLIVFLILFVDRKLLPGYRPPSTGGIYVEAFAIYLGGMTAADLALPFMPGMIQRSLVTHVGLMFGPTILAMCWPMLRGIRFWRNAFGWHFGTGMFREIGFGLVGYIAGLPVLAVGFIITAILINRSGAHPSHPIEHMLGVSPKMTIIVLCLASIYAPLTEETMFRGALFSGLRARHRWFLSAIVSSFIFAAIHPQGWSTIPLLMSIAVVLAAIREWRGTIVSSAAAHSLHNTMALVVAILMMS